MIAAGKPPDPWQDEFLNDATDRVLMLCARQMGKSTVVAALALQEAINHPGALILILAYNTAQAMEMFRKVMNFYNATSVPIRPVYQTLKNVEWANGSRIICVPGNEDAARSYSAPRLVIVDEAARVPDDAYEAVNPTRATSAGRLLCLSTPKGKRGWFYTAFYGEHGQSPDPSWKRILVTADQCPRIPAEFLDEQRIALGLRKYQQEYECVFHELEGQYFRPEDIAQMASPDVQAMVFDFSALGQ